MIYLYIYAGISVAIFLWTLSLGTQPLLGVLFGAFLWPITVPVFCYQLGKARRELMAEEQERIEKYKSIMQKFNDDIARRKS